jgi:hypothetical protein
MKFILFLLSAFLIAGKVTGQDTALLVQKLARRVNRDAPSMLAKDVAKHIGSEVYVRDTIFSHNTTNPSQTLLYLGNKYPNHKLIVIIKGKKLNKQLSRLTQGIGCFSGKAILYHGKPTLIITNINQASNQILI